MLRSPGFWGLVTTTLLALLLWGALERSGGVGALRQQVSPWWLLPSLPALTLLAVSPLPTEALAAAAVVVFGPWRGVALTWVAWVVAARIEAGLVTRTAADIEFDSDEHLPRWLRSFPVDNWVFLIAGRWIPTGPHVVNVAAGLMGVPPWKHVLAAAIADIPILMLISGATEWWLLPGP